MLKIIRLLAHSGFLLELTEAWLVFDYFQDPKQVLHLLQKSSKPVLFMVTHLHHDHWRPEILDFPQTYALREAAFVLDETCLRTAKGEVLRQIRAWEAQNRLLVVHCGDVLDPTDPSDFVDLARFGIREIRVTGSTDAGSSFLVALTDGEILFFAGDLNDWDWQDPDSPAMAAAFAEEIQTIQQNLRSLGGDDNSCIHWLFAPLDKRLGCKAMQGPCQFIETFQPKHFVPMHLAEGYELPALLQEKTPVTVIQTLLHPGDTYSCTSST